MNRWRLMGLMYREASSLAFLIQIFMSKNTALLHLSKRSMTLHSCSWQIDIVAIICGLSQDLGCVSTRQTYHQCIS